MPMINAHSGEIQVHSRSHSDSSGARARFRFNRPRAQDLDFSPFDDSVLASASDDATIRVWRIPDDFSVLLSLLYVYWCSTRILEFSRSHERAGNTDEVRSDAERPREARRLREVPSVRIRRDRLRLHRRHRPCLGYCYFSTDTLLAAVWLWLHLYRCQQMLLLFTASCRRAPADREGEPEGR